MVELQANYSNIKKLGAEVLVVLREEKEALAGLKKTAEKMKAEFPILNDLNREQTARYSAEGFVTCVIDKKGRIRTILGGNTDFIRCASRVAVLPINSSGRIGFRCVRCPNGSSP